MLLKFAYSRVFGCLPVQVAIVGRLARSCTLLGINSGLERARAQFICDLFEFSDQLFLVLPLTTLDVIPKE